jgi:hypothetical protein
MVLIPDEPGAKWALLVECLTRLHDVLLAEACDRPELGIAPTVAAAGLREVLERVGAAQRPEREPVTAVAADDDALQLARDCVRELLDPELELDCTQLLTLASAAHVLARVEEALAPVSR